MEDCLFFVTDFTILSTIGMTINTVFTNTPHMGVFILANAFVLCIVVTSPAIHGKGPFIFRFVAVMAGITCYVITIGRSMGQVIENHPAAIGIKFHFTRWFDNGKILCIMTKFTVNRTLQMTASTISTDTLLMDGFILTRIFKFPVVMALPAIGGKIIFNIIKIMMALFAEDIPKGYMYLVIEYDTTTLGIKGHTPGFFLRLESI
jgi:hypothetical protein